MYYNSDEHYLTVLSRDVLIQELSGLLAEHSFLAMILFLIHCFSCGLCNSVNSLKKRLRSDMKRNKGFDFFSNFASGRRFWE